eukprot:6656781-Prymnesium_polylepis.2
MERFTHQLSAIERSHTGPEGGGLCDLYSYPIATFHADGGELLTVAMTGEHFDFVRFIVRDALADVRRSRI